MEYRSRLSKEKLIIVDMRSAEHLGTFGAIAGADVGIGGKAFVKGLLHARYQILVIVNDVVLAEELVRDNISNVCSLVYDEAVPKELQS